MRSLGIKALVDNVDELLDWVVWVMIMLMKLGVEFEEFGVSVELVKRMMMKSIRAKGFKLH